MKVSKFSHLFLLLMASGGAALRFREDIRTWISHQFLPRQIKLRLKEL